ncbi:MAG: ROK family protein [Oscillospiraceae bacterium]
MMNVSGKGQNNENLLNINRSLIVQHLQRDKVCTRSQLSKALGLTPASITKTVAGLMENGLVEEIGFVQGEKGRRSIGITLRADLCKLIGVKLSRRNFSVGVFDMTGENFGVHSESFSEDELLPGVLDKIIQVIEGYMSRFDNVAAIGVAVPGPYLVKESRMVLVTETIGWKEVNLQEYLGSAFSVPVIIRHDANSGALAEWWFGTQIHQQGETLIHYLVGEGVGAGIIIDGEILTGDNGIAGEIGHVSIDVNGPHCTCGNRGCLELYCSSLAFVKHAKSKLPEHPESTLTRYGSLTFSSIFEAANQGDRFAISLVRRAGRYIGYGAAAMINTYDPSTIVISNDMAGGGQTLLEEALAVVRERIAPHIAENVSIELSRFPNDPILYGAAAVAIDFCLKRPEILMEMQKQKR